MEAISRVWPFRDVPSDAISIYCGPDVFLDDYQDVTHVERTLFVAYWLQAEILNGGLLQFFSNDTGVLAPEAAVACRTFGLPVLADFLELSAAS
jgi:hypothetical protein